MLSHRGIAGWRLASDTEPIKYAAEKRNGKLEHSRQICYVAWGSDHVRLAARSARTAKLHTPNVHVVAHLNEPPCDTDLTAFDEFVVDVPNTNVIGLKQSEGGKKKGREVDPGLSAFEHWWWRVSKKPAALMHSSADYTIYLDADTLVATDLGEIFDLLKSCDIAAVIDGSRSDVGFYRRVSENLELSEVPASEPFLNCGVLGIRHSKKMGRFLQEWHDAIRMEADVPMDQWTFRRLIYASDLKLRVLPPEFNVTIWGPVDLNGPVRILHTYDVPGYSAPELLAFLNSWTGRQVFTPHDGKLLEQMRSSEARCRYFRDYQSKKVHYDIPKMTFGQHLHDILPSLMRSLRYRLFGSGAPTRSHPDLGV